MTTLLIGTTKGLFRLTEGPGGWTVDGPLCEGWTINHTARDPGSGRLYAGGGSDWSGAGVWRSNDGGATWTLSRLSPGQMDAWAKEDPDFAAMIGWTPEPLPFPAEEAQSVWSLLAAHGRVWAGVKPGRLFVSEDGGVTWAGVAGFNDHPTRETWQGGAAGLVPHTLVPHPTDPDRLWLAMSSAGVFATEDGGATWGRRNRLANAEACGPHDHPAAPRDGETGHCVHNMVRAPGGTGDVLWQQNHHGVWRSPDGGRNWIDAGQGLPSTFGFPIAVHPTDPDTAWTLPLNGDSEGRYPPGAAAAVWRTRDGGASWQDFRAGLPQTACFFTVLRQAMTSDPEAGVYFGTNTGSVFASRDAGETWDEAARHLPLILSVELGAPA